MTYPGGKNATFRHIINEMPPHDIFVELFGGSGAVTRHKKSARRYNYFVELNPEQAAAAQLILPASTSVIQGDAIQYGEWLEKLARAGTLLIYADPPYLFTDENGEPVRSSQRELYEYEFGEVAQHTALLSMFLRLSPMALIMVSGYRSALYDRLLKGWRRVEFIGYDRQNRPRTECLWCNFPAAVELHEYTWLGENKMERQCFKRKRERFKAKLGRMSPIERHALLSAVAELRQLELAARTGRTEQPEATASPAVQLELASNLSA